MKLINIISFGAAVLAYDPIVYRGKYGEFLTCPEGYLATGMCGSGRDADCGKGTWNELECKKYSTYTADSKWANTKYGVVRKCAKNQAMVGICGAGMWRDCKGPNGTWSHAASLCADIDDYGVDDAKKMVIKGDYGQRISCPSDFVMVSYCGSGSNPDCGDGKYTQIECAPLAEYPMDHFTPSPKK